MAFFSWMVGSLQVRLLKDSAHGARFVVLGVVKRDLGTVSGLDWVTRKLCAPLRSEAERERGKETGPRMCHNGNCSYITHTAPFIRPTKNDYTRKALTKKRQKFR